MTANVKTASIVNASDGHPINPEGRNSRMAERAPLMEGPVCAYYRWCEMMIGSKPGCVEATRHSLIKDAAFMKERLKTSIRRRDLLRSCQLSALAQRPRAPLCWSRWTRNPSISR